MVEVTPLLGAVPPDDPRAAVSAVRMRMGVAGVVERTCARRVDALRLDLRPFLHEAEVRADEANARVLTIHEPFDDDLVDLEVWCSLQDDLAMTVTVAVQRDGSGSCDDDEPEAWSTTIPVGASSTFGLTLRTRAGDAVTARGSVWSAVACD